MAVNTKPVVSAKGRFPPVLFPFIRRLSLIILFVIDDQLFVCL